VAVASHPELLAVAVDCGARQVERFATSRTLVARADEKLRLGKQAEAVEMESYTILAEAARYGVQRWPFGPSATLWILICLTILNARAMFADKFALPALRAGVAPSVGRACAVALARDCRVAARHLADFLDIYTGTLGDRLIPVEPGLVAAQ